MNCSWVIREQQIVEVLTASKLMECRRFIRNEAHIIVQHEDAVIVLGGADHGAGTEDGFRSGQENCSPSSVAEECDDGSDALFHEQEIVDVLLKQFNLVIRGESDRLEFKPSDDLGSECP